MSLHAKHRVDRAGLAALPEPESRGPRHKPVPHIAVVEAIERAAQKRDLAIARESFALVRGGNMIFGVLDFHPHTEDTEVDGRISMGFRGSNDQQLSLQMVAGVRVLVCDNLAFSGDMFALHRKHTTGLDLAAEMDEAFDRYLAHERRLSAAIDQLQAYTLDDDDAKRLIFDAFAATVLPISHFPRVASHYFGATPDMTDCTPRNRWGLHNAFTRAIKRMSPETGFRSRINLGQFFGIGTEA